MSGPLVPGLMFPRFRGWFEPVAAGVLYCLLAALTIHFASEGRGDVSTIWPANAVLLAMMLRHPRRDGWGAILIAGFVGNAIANVVTRGTVTAPLLYGAANVVEVTIAAWALRTTRRRFDEEGSLSIIWQFVFWAGLVAPGVAGLMGATSAWAVFDQPFTKSLITWVVSDSIGLLLCTPFFYSVFNGDFVRLVAGQTWRRQLEVVGLFLLTGTLTFMISGLAQRPLLFLIFMPLMIVTFRLGWVGTKLALMIVAVVGLLCTMNGHGPISHLVSDPATRVHFFQVFLGGVLLIMMPVAVAISARDILTRKLAESERSLRLLASQSPVLLLEFTMDGLCKKALGAADALLCRETSSLVGRSFAQICEEGQLAMRTAHERALDDAGGLQHGEFRAFNSSGKWLEVTFRTVEEDGRCSGTLATIHDITARKEQELALSRSARTDSLTGLLNRAGFLARLEQVLLSRPAGIVSLALVDVDRFKLINDNSGHQTGDVVLQEIAARISGELRSSDAVGRLGGDEFVILLVTPSREIAIDICSRVVASVSTAPVDLPAGGQISTAISCGLARYRPGLSAEEFIHEADLALYEAKRNGRNRMIAA